MEPEFKHSAEWREQQRIRVAKYRSETSQEGVKRRNREYRMRKKLASFIWPVSGPPPHPIICPLCLRPPTKRGWFADHCHDSMRFRGWLCMRCNSALGTFGDSIDGILRVLAYLRAAEEST